MNDVPAIVQDPSTGKWKATLDFANAVRTNVNTLIDAVGNDPAFSTTVAALIAACQPLDADLTALAALTSPATKLAGIAAGATVNATDAALLNRANHAGQQLSTTISDFLAAVVAAAPSLISSTAMKNAFSARAAFETYRGVSVLGYGHSWMAGTAQTRMKWLDRLGTEIHSGQVTNRGVTGSMARDVFSAIANTNPIAQNTTGVVVIQASLNDARRLGTDARGVSAYKRTMQAIIHRARAGTKSEESAATFGGTWASVALPDSNASGGFIAAAQNVNAYADITFTGTEVVIGTYKMAVGQSGGQFTVKEGATLLGTYNAAPATDGPPATYPYTAAQDFIRITGLSAGSHTLRIQCSDISGFIWFDYWSTPAATPPTVVLVADPYLANYSAGSPFNQGSNAAIDAYKAALIEIATAFPANEVIVVDGNTSWDSATMIGADTVHPNDRGAARLAQTVADGMLTLDYRDGLGTTTTPQFVNGGSGVGTNDLGSITGKTSAQIDALYLSPPPDGAIATASLAGNPVFISRRNGKWNYSTATLIA